MATPQEEMKIYEAYSSGAMSPEQIASYQEAVSSGVLNLPEGATLVSQTTEAVEVPTLSVRQDQAASPEPETAPEPSVKSRGMLPRKIGPNTLEDLKNDHMSVSRLKDLSRAISAGYIEAPEGVEIPDVSDAGIADEIKDALEAKDKQTKEIQSLPDWSNMPEYKGNVKEQDLYDIWRTAKTIGTTLFSDAEETKSLISGIWPTVEVRQDRKGNYIFKSGVDGKEYALKPEVTTNDIGRLMVGGSVFGPAARTGGLVAGPAIAAGTQTAIEAAQASEGGTFDTENVLLAGLGEVAGELIGRTPGAIKKALGGVEEVVPDDAKTNVLKAAAKAEKRGVKGAKDLAQEVMPIPEAVSAAQRQDVVDLVQPDMLSGNQQFIELQQLAKSEKGSLLNRQEVESLNILGDKFRSILEESGGTKDYIGLSNRVKEATRSTIDDAYEEAEKLYKLVDQSIPEGSTVTPNSTLEYLENKLKVRELSDLAPIERKVYKRLTKEGGATYEVFDDLRKDVGFKSRQKGIARDENTGRAKQLYGKMLEDQKSTIDRIGGESAKETYESASSATKLAKSLEDKEKYLFGVSLQDSMVDKLRTATGRLSAPDTTQFVKLINSVPKQYRKEVVSSGLLSAMGNANERGVLNYKQFGDWFKGLNESKSAKVALFSNLDDQTKQAVKDYGLLSRHISKSLRTRPTGGETLQDVLKNVDNTVKNLSVLAAKSLAAEVPASLIAQPGMGTAFVIGTAVKKNNKKAGEALSQVLSDPQFKKLLVDAAQNAPIEESAKKASKTKAFKRFWNGLGDSRPRTAPEQWLISSLQAGKQSQTAQEAIGIPSLQTSPTFEGSGPDNNPQGDK